MSPTSLLPRRLGWQEARRRRRVIGVARHGMRMVFQPIRDLTDGSVAGYEALARFPSGQPDAWFDEAHRVGLGEELEMAAIVDAISLQRPGWGYVSVNASPATVTTRAFLEFVAALDDPRRLVVELTEHTAVDDYGQLSSAIGRLREIGVRIAVDDAGGGISSFRHVIMISPHIIKLDRSLIADLDHDDNRAALAEAMVHFADRIGAALVAEGIEREEERVACRQQGIRYGQGFLLGTPQPLDTTLVAMGDKGSFAR